MTSERYSRHSTLATYRVSIPGRTSQAELWQPRLHRTPESKSNSIEIQQNERLDTLAYRTLGDAFAGWKLADENASYDPYELLEAGRIIKVPLNLDSDR